MATTLIPGRLFFHDRLFLAMEEHDGHSTRIDSEFGGRKVFEGVERDLFRYRLVCVECDEIVFGVADEMEIEIAFGNEDVECYSIQVRGDLR